MKKVVFLLPVILVSILLYAQPQANKSSSTNKISISIGQKIIVENTISMESSMSPGMDITNSTTSENLLEVKNNTDNNYTLSNSLTKIKVNMSMMGQASTYDSEKKEDQDSEIGKAFAGKLNKPTDIILDINTGKAIPAKQPEKKKEVEEGNPMQGLLQMLGDNGGDDAIVAGAFELIPQGKSTGDSWIDSSIDKTMKVVRTYTLKSVTDKEAVIGLLVIMDGTNTLEMQGMEIEFSSTTKTTGEIILNIETGLVKKKTSQSEITGSFQMMGQSVPISAKANSTSTYK